MKRTFNVMVLIVVLVAGLFLSPVYAKKLSGPAPDFTLKSKQGENIKLSDLRGQVVMINFWASWCGPCRQEMPFLEQIYKRYKPMGFTLLGVNVEEDSLAANDMLDEVKVTFPILYDTKSAVSEKYNVDAMPSTVLVDRDGNLRHLHRGYVPGTEVEYQKQVRALVRE